MNRQYNRRCDGQLRYTNGHDNTGIEALPAFQKDAERGSTILKARLDAFFSRWEMRHGFRPGAGAILVPAGYDPTAKKIAA